MKNINSQIAAIQKIHPVTLAEHKIWQVYGSSRNTGWLQPSFIADPISDDLLVDLTAFKEGVDWTHHELHVALGVKIKDARIIAANYVGRNFGTEIEMRLSA